MSTLPLMIGLFVLCLVAAGIMRHQWMRYAALALAAVQAVLIAAFLFR